MTHFMDLNKIMSFIHTKTFHIMTFQFKKYFSMFLLDSLLTDNVELFFGGSTNEFPENCINSLRLKHFYFQVKSQAQSYIFFFNFSNISKLKQFDIILRKYLAISSNFCNM